MTNYHIAMYFRGFQIFAMFVPMWTIKLSSHKTLGTWGVHQQATSTCKKTSRCWRMTSIFCGERDMALLHYLKWINGLPDPKGPLSKTISSFAIEQPNQEVSCVQQAEPSLKKRGSYNKTSDCVRAKVDMPVSMECCSCALLQLQYRW